MAAIAAGIDNISFFSEEKITNKTQLFDSIDEPREQKPGLLKSSLFKLASFITPFSIIQSAANKTSRFKNFFLFSFLAAFFFIFAITSLPMVLIFPEKFAMFFSIASLIMHLALSYLKPSFEEYMKALVSNNDYSTISTVYLVSLFFTLYASVYLGNYIIVLAACGLQMFSIGWFLVTMFPRGSQGILTVFRYSLKLCPCGKDLMPV
jgi:hypothetical protein